MGFFPHISVISAVSALSTRSIFKLRDQVQDFCYVRDSAYSAPTSSTPV